jgi:HAD superfamily hydrolase (TIGR01549 family)
MVTLPYSWRKPMNILWDFDGTLFDTYPAYSKIFHQVLNEIVDMDEIYQHLKISFSHAIQFYQLTKNQLDEIKILEAHLSPEDIHPFPGVEEVLKYAELNVIMTHKDRKGILDILKHYEWEDYFTEIVTIDDGFPRKPDHSSYKYLHDKYKIDLVIGDRELDIIPGKKLGINTCLFRHQSEVADYHLEDYADFFKTINLKD